MAKKTKIEYGAEAEATLEAGVQAKNMQTTVTVGETMPMVDTEEFTVRAKFTQNGDIKDPSTGESILAKKMVEEAHQYAVGKSVYKPFPETGAAYLETLDFKVNA